MDGRVVARRASRVADPFSSSLRCFPVPQHLVWFPDAFNSHAVIIARDPKGFPDHALGKVVLKHWAEGMAVSP